MTQNILFRQIISLKKCKFRNYSYKPIKRVSLDSLPVTKFSKHIEQNEKHSTPSLAEHLKSKIRATGPITVAEYMREVLTNSSDGYYMKKDVFGMDGDFITSPEITQIFGELLGIWCINEWKKIGAQHPVQLVEFGPGRGTLIQDLLRVFEHFGIGQHISVHLIEVSPFLGKIQAQFLCPVNSVDVESDPKNGIFHYREGTTVTGIKVYWYKKLEDVPKNFSIYIAHEFFDALPIHKFQKINDKDWREVLVDIDLESSKDFRLILAKEETPHLKIFSNKNLGVKQDHVEYSIDMELIISELIDRLESYGGFSLIVDYGHSGEKGDTFRSFFRHKLHDPLVNPGTADLTADVDFFQLKKFAEHDHRLVTFGPVEQSVFLRQMGGEQRLKALLDHNVTKENAENLKHGYEMLTNSTKMGKRFKLFAMYPIVLQNLLTKIYPAGFKNDSN